MRRMKVARWLTLVLLVPSWVEADGPEAPDEVLVLTRDLPEGAKLENADLRLVPMDPEFASSSQVVSQGLPYVVGQRLLRALLKGDLLRWDDVSARAEHVDACLEIRHTAASPSEEVARQRARILAPRR